MLKLKLLLVVLITTLIVGCTPFFVKEDKPIILDNNTGIADNDSSSQSEDNKELLIESINSTLLDGMVYDISKDGRYLLVSSTSSESNYYNLDTFDIKNKSLKQVFVSSKENINAVFDDDDSMFYVEYSKDENDKPISDSYRLNWTDAEGNVTKNISQPSESVSPKFSLVNDSLLIYGNTVGEIKFVKIKDISKENIPKDTYRLTEKLNIYKVDYYQDYNLCFFLAKNPKNNTLDLYYSVLDKHIIEPTLLQTNVSDFSISTENECVLYNVNNENSNQLVCVDMYYNKQVIYEGRVSSFEYTPSQEKIVFSEQVDSASNAQNLWVMNANGSDKIQLASNLKIANDNLVLDPKNQTIYFTVYQLDETETNTLSYKVYMMEFSDL